MSISAMLSIVILQAIVAICSIPLWDKHKYWEFFPIFVCLFWAVSDTVVFISLGSK